MLIEAIEWFIENNGYSPTYRELAVLLHTSSGTMLERVLLLEKKGYLSSENGKARSIKVIKGVIDEKNQEN